MTTRHAKPGSAPRQERFASSYSKGLLANLVAKRCGTLKSPEDRACVWFAQWASWQPGGLEKFFADDIAWIEEDCLSPAEYVWRKQIAARREAWLSQLPEPVETEISRRVADALDFTRRSRCLTLIEGPARIGKSFSAFTYCQRGAGLVRYVECPASNDDIGFFRAIATSLGVSSSLQLKAAELRLRIEETLACGDLTLVIDEAWALWPQSWQRYAMPSRVSWVMSLINREIPVALVTAPQFHTAQKRVERLTGWNSAQFIGRVGHIERLPERLEKTELAAIAKSLFPEGDADTWRAIAAYADLAQTHLAAVVALIKRARWLAEKSGKTEAGSDDIRAAIRECAPPSLREQSAARSPAPRERRETILQNRMMGSKKGMVLSG